MANLIEKKRKEIELIVCDLYRQSMEEEPESSWYKRMVMIASQTGLSHVGVSKILNRCGIFNPRRAHKSEAL